MILHVLRIWAKEKDKGAILGGFFKNADQTNAEEGGVTLGIMGAADDDPEVTAADEEPRAAISEEAPR